MSSRNCYLGNKQAVVSRNSIMIAWAIVDLYLHTWIENNWVVVGQNYCGFKCIFGHVSIYKGSADEIL